MKISLKQFGWRMVLSALIFCLLAACHQAVQNTGASTETRLIEHAMGRSQVPLVPQRVVTLDSAPLDAALALEVKPVGSAGWDGEFAEYLGDRTIGIAAVGTPNGPSLEAIIELKPDLILGSKVVAEKIYPQLMQIAPTVLTEETGRDGNWPDNLRLYADALGKRDLAEQLLKTYRDRIAALKQQMQNAQETVVSIVASHQGAVYFYSEKSFAGTIFKELGFKRPPIQTRPPIHVGLVSNESFEQLDGDYIFLLTGKVRQQLSLNEFIKDPLYSQLSAVKKGEIYDVPSEVWAGGRNILAAHRVLDDITKVMVK